MSQQPPPPQQQQQQQQPRYNPSNAGRGGRGMNPVPYGVHPGMGGPPPHMVQQQQMQQQQMQQQQMQQSGMVGVVTGPQGAGRGSAPTGAWQPAAPTSLQQASVTTGVPYHPGAAPFGRGGGGGGSLPPNAGVAPYHPQQQQPPPQQQQQFQNPYYSAHSYRQHPHMQQQQQPQAYMQNTGGHAGVVPNPSWQAMPPTGPQHYGANMYYAPGPNPQLQLSQPPLPPNNNNTAQMPNMQPLPALVAPPPRERKILKITDKDGNVIDFTGEAAKRQQQQRQQQQPSSLQTAAATPTAPTTPSAAAAATAAPAVAATSNFHQVVLGLVSGKVSREQVTEAEEAAAKKKQEEEEAAAAAALKKKEEEEARLKLEEEAARKKKEEDEARLLEEEAKRQEAEQAAAAALEAQAKAAAAEQARKQLEEQELAKQNAAKEATSSSSSSLQAAAAPPRGGLRPGGPLQPKSKSPLRSASATRTSPRHVYTKEDLLRLREMEVCHIRPDSLPDMTIVKGPSRGRSGGAPQGGGGGDRGGGDRGDRGGDRGGGGGGSQWARGSAAPPRRSSSGTLETMGNNNNNNNTGGGQWSRGQAPPKPTPQQQQQQQKGGRNNRGGQRGGPPGPPLLEGPVAPLVRSENRWMPQKNASVMIVAEKKVKAILNKMTKEKFAKLSDQMCEIPILSFEMLTMIIHNVYEKAIDEPSFGDMYADLCIKLSQAMQADNFVKIIESDEDPPTEDEEDAGAAVRSVGQKESSSYTVYRWSNDVSTTDAEVVGPLESADECIQVALAEKEQPAPILRGDMELELDRLLIRNGTFVKILKKKNAEEGESAIFYTVYFPVSEAKDCGQQLSKIFLTERECVKDSVKDNSFKSVLLNKCEDEFNKQDIYVDWKKEKKEYEESKSSLTEGERAEKEEELEFRRIRIKKQMLGNIKFIGQLYKKALLKERIMRYCISSLLKLEQVEGGKAGEYQDKGDNDIDEEDHEALCNLFETIGSTIEKPAAASFMNMCFNKIKKLSNDKTLSSRVRFMYKDLIELRSSNWVPRRAVEKAKTLEEIRKDVEQEQRQQAQQSQQMGGGHRGPGRGSDRDFRGSSSGDFRTKGASFANRPTKPKPAVQADEDGFTVVGRGVAAAAAAPATKAQVSQPSRAPVPTKAAAAAPVASDVASDEKSIPSLSPDVLKRRINSMRNEFVQDPNNVEDLLLSADEISGTPNSKVTLLEMTGDKLMDCKDSERKSIIDMVRVLYENQKITKDDVQEGFAGLIEFIDAVVPDCPKAYEYLGELLSMLLHSKAVDVLWLCEQSEKANQENPEAAMKVIRATVNALKKNHGADEVKSVFGGSSEGEALSKLLGSDVWRAIAESN